MRRSVLVAVLLGASFLLLPVGASAFGGLDPSFGKRGVVHLQSASPDEYNYADDLAVAPDGAVYVLWETVTCDGSACDSSPYLTRLKPDGSPDSGYGGDGFLELPEGHSQYDLAVDTAGRPVLATAGLARLRVLRLRGDGALDLSFGEAGSVDLGCICPGGAKLALGAPGYLRLMTVAYERVRRGPARGTVRALVEVLGLTSAGVPEPGFGADGRVDLTIPRVGSVRLGPRLAGGGTLLFGNGEAQEGGIYVAKLGLRGGFDASFTSETRRTIAAWIGGRGRPVASGLVPRSGGRIDLLGTFGRYGFALRLEPDGRLSRDFGRSGAIRYPWTVDRLIAGPGGRVFTVGRLAGFRARVAWLGPEGSPLESFADGRGARVPGIPPRSVTLALQPWGRPLMLEPDVHECRTFCPPQPTLRRFTRWAPR